MDISIRSARNNILVFQISPKGLKATLLANCTRRPLCTKTIILAYSVIPCLQVDPMETGRLAASLGLYATLFCQPKL